MRKALWVVRDRITTAKAIDDLLADATTRGIFDVVVQIRGRGDAYYRSDLEPQALALAGSELDPLDHLVRFGAAVGVRIHAWGNVFFVWSDPQGVLPSSPAHLVNRHPEWLLRPGGVKYLDPVGGTDWEGIYIDPRSPAAREHTLAVFTDIVSRYAVEGFHYDYVRYPQVTYAASPDDHEHVTTLVREGAKRLRRARLRRRPRCGAVSWRTKESGSCCAIKCAPRRARAAKARSCSRTTPNPPNFWMFSPRPSGGATLLSPCRTNRHQHRSQRRRPRSRAVPTRSPLRWPKASCASGGRPVSPSARRRASSARRRRSSDEWRTRDTFRRFARCSASRSRTDT